MELNTQYFSILDLLDGIKQGKLVLPEFQRQFEWKPAAIADLLRTMVRKWPAGTLLFLKSEGGLVLAPKAIEHGPDPTEISYYILDGQQRLTSVFHAFEEQGEDIYYLKLGEMVETGDFDDEHLVYEKKHKFHKKYPGIDQRAKDLILEVGGVREEARFGEWCDYLPKEERQAYRNLREKVLDGLRSYRFPALVLEKSIPLQAVAKIFETINKTGVQLGFMDLMVAKLYPLEFRLRDKVKEAIDANPILGKFGFTGEEVIQLIALREYFRQTEEKLQKKGEKNAPAVKVKGIRQGDMLVMEPEVVVANWASALADYVRAVEFLKKNCGVLGSQFLPAEAMVIPLADALSVGSGRSGFDKDLIRWFWCSTFTQTYSQGANTQAVRDARELRAWRISELATPQSVTEAITEFDPDLIAESRKRNEMALRGLMSFLVLNDARDLLTAQAIREVDPALIDMHHVFPENYLKKASQNVLDKLVNFSPVLRETNIKLRDFPPSEMLKRSDFKAQSLSGHMLDSDALSANNFTKFFAERQKRLSSGIKNLIAKNHEP